MTTAAPSKTAAGGGGANHSRGDQTSRSVDNRKSRLAPLWPEWNDADVNAESWEVGSGKKKETAANRARVDTKSAIVTGTHGFEDPEGKIELPPTLKVDQWKRPVDFLPPDRPPVIVDVDQGMQNFDLVTPNEHLHFNDTMRNIISQITALWDVCRRERKSTNTPSEISSEPNPAVLSGRTWRPWEHIYALNKVSRQPFITPYNPAGKYVLRLFFLGTWRKIVVDDTIPFDSKNRCLLPQTSLPYELWPILLSKGLLKIMSLDYRSPNTNPPTNETSIIHTLTGWLPEPIPLKYTHAGKVWKFLRDDRSNKLVTENEINKPDQNPTSPLPTYGPVPLFKWPEPKIEVTEEATSSHSNEQAGHQDDTATETLTKKSDEKSQKKAGAPASLTVPKDPTTKAAAGKESRTGKDSKRFGGAGRGGASEDPGAIIDDQTIPEAPKMIVFASIPQLQPARISAYGEVADRSERLRRYNLNDTFATTMLLTTIRDIPLEPPPLPEQIPSWKLIRPKKTKILPHAEPFTPREPKPDRWIEITSPYINYPSPSALNIKPTIRLHMIDSCITNVSTPNHGTTSRLSHSATHSTIADVPEIIEVDEDEDAEHNDSKLDIDNDQGDINQIGNRKEESISQTKEMIIPETPDVFDESVRSAGSKLRRERSADKNKNNRKLTSSKIEVASVKPSSDAVSVKSKTAESEQTVTQLDAPGTATATNPEQQDSQSKTNDANSGPKIVQPTKKAYTTPKIWMDFDDFCSCFTSIVVFHNPRGYQYSHKHTELRYFAAQQPVVTSVTKEKKKDPNPSIAQQVPNLQDEKSSLYLFVDNTREAVDKNIELIVGLTSLSRWHDLGQPEGSGPPAPAVSTIPEKVGRNTSLSTDRGPAEVSPARGKHRPSVFESPQTPAPHGAAHDGNSTENTAIAQKDTVSQPGSLIAEIYSWKSVSMGQPILRLHTTATKAALLTLPPGRHVLKFTVTCPLASHLQIMSDTHDFTFGDEDQLLAKVVSAPEDTDFILRAEELFLALDDSIQNFNNMDQQDNRLQELFRLYCDYAPESAHLTVQTCWKVFNEAIYTTLRNILANAGQALNTETQFAWRCFTNDLTTTDIMGVYETKHNNLNATRNSARPNNATVPANPAPTGTSTTAKKGGGGKDKGGTDDKASKQQQQLAASLSVSDLQEEPVSDWLTRELSANEMDAIVNIQKSARGYLQRRILNARTPGTERNLLIQRALQGTMTILKNDMTKSAVLLFRNLLVIKPQLIQCFQFSKDDWNMVTYRDYHGQHQEQPANTWFTLFRDIFYATEDGFVSAKLLAHAQNSILRVINNDTYDEMPLIFNRLAPAKFIKNKLGYTFFAEGVTLDQPLVNNRYRLRLLTSYTHLPEPRSEQLTSAFVTKESKGYYVPNRDLIICRYRVIVGDDSNQTGRNFHLASLQFTTSKSDVLMRLTVFDGSEEIVRVEGKGNVVLPAVLFLRDVTNTVSTAVQAPSAPTPQVSTTAATASPLTSRPASKTGGKKDSKSGAGTARGSISETTPLPTTNARPEKEKIGSGKRSRSSSRVGVVLDEEEKFHKYVIQVTLLRKSWPLTETQWKFVEQLKEQEKNDLKIFKQPVATKVDGTTGATAGTTGAGKGKGATGTGATAAGKGKGATAAAGATKGSTGTSGRPGTGKGNVEKPLDTTKAHWILRVVCDADKADELTIKKDTERHEELINTKKAWETLETGRAQKAMQTRQKFLDSLQPKVEERPLSATTDGTTKSPETQPSDKPSTTTAPSTVPPAAEQQPVAKQTPAATTKKGISSTGTKKGAAKDEATKQAELAAAAAAQQEAAPLVPPMPIVDEPLLDQPPPTKPKIILPPLDIKPFTKHKLLGDETIIIDPLFEEEELRRRQAEFLEYAKYADEIRQYRTEDQNNRYKEKIRQLEEYVDLQGKIDQFRRTVNEPREAFRQRFLEVERKRLAELAAREQELIAAAEKNKPPATEKGKKGKGSAGKKGKK
ncbi:hypothetical protein I4U23_017808 [Adineta vaga]|nr:hypothetical protein I4U23_017808 [Adineta vaga]